MLRSFIISIVLLASACSTGLFAQSNSIDCSEFRKGKYFYTSPNGGEVTFKRKKKKQIERYNMENQRFIFSIIWSDNCHYTLTLVNAKGIDKKLKEEIIGSKLQCEVLAVELGHYKVKMTTEDFNEMVIIYTK